MHFQLISGGWVDFIVSAIKDRFDQPGYKALQQLEDLLVKAAKVE